MNWKFWTWPAQIRELKRKLKLAAANEEFWASKYATAKWELAEREHLTATAIESVELRNKEIEELKTKLRGAPESSRLV